MSPAGVGYTRIRWVRGVTVGDEPGSFRRRLAPHPESVGEARRMVRRSLARAGRDDLAETAGLLVSEVVTNALVHAGTPIDVTVSVTADGLRVEVEDGSPHLPSRRDYAPTAGTGRGMMLLEQMVDDWGVVAGDHGKTVWFTLTSSDQSPGGHSTWEGGTATAPESATTVAVQLLNVPLLLHAAWRQHAEALLREHLLARLDADPDPSSDADPIQEHAEASDALALLAERIPGPELGGDPDQLMGAATEPTVSCPRVDVLVPAESVAHFHTLNRALKDAVAAADTDMFLTPPVQPELQAFRRWVCHQVIDQSTAAVPTAWAAEDQPPTPARTPTWDTRPVTDSAAAMVAADDTDRIIAVSRPCLELLGYDEQAQLVGKRLVAIIPERYRQAHLAGFTLHFLTGRSPLLGRPVVVPAQRRDGTEVMVQLTVTAEQASFGRTVFLADFREPTGP